MTSTRCSGSSLIAVADDTASGTSVGADTLVAVALDTRMVKGSSHLRGESCGSSKKVLVIDIGARFSVSLRL